jgi:hypothetical protein
MISVLQSANGFFDYNSNGSFSKTLAFSSSISATSMLVVMVSTFDPSNGTTLNVPTDTLLNIYTLQVSETGDPTDGVSNNIGIISAIYMAPDSGLGSNTVTISGTQTGGFSNETVVTAVILEVAGMGSAPTLNSHNVAATSTTFPPSGPTLNPTVASSIAVANYAYFGVGNNQPCAAGTGWTLDGATQAAGNLVPPDNASIFPNLGGEHQILSSSSALTCQMSNPSFFMKAWLSCACNFVPGSGGGGGSSTSDFLGVALSSRNPARF